MGADAVMHGPTPPLTACFQAAQLMAIHSNRIATQQLQTQSGS